MAETHDRTRLGILFGSRSVEHEVSIITATQLMRSVDERRYQVVPLYVDKRGRWWTGEDLRYMETFQELNLQAPEEDLPDIVPITFDPDPTVDHGVDVVIFCSHGGHGEDGTMAGLMELANIPYAAPGVVAAGVAIDKILTKHVAQAANIPVTPYVWFTRQQWQEDRKGTLQRVMQLEGPWFVKPATLGSSVGVSRAADEKELRDAIDLAAEFDARLIVEEAARDCIEVNVSVTGTLGQYRVSTTEQPIQTDEFLSYADKYERGGGKKGATKGMAGLSRRIPAPITATLSSQIQSYAEKFWDVIGGKGVARIDFFANPSTEEVFLGEVNAPPGSMSFYLWEATELPYDELIDELVEQAQAAHAEKMAGMQSIESNILKQSK